MTGRLRDLALSVLAAGLVAGGVLAAAPQVHDWRVADPLPVGDRVREAAEALRGGDPVHVAADAHDRIVPADERALEELAASSPTPLFIVVWEDSRQAGYYTVYDALDQLERLVDRDGVYVIWSGSGQGLIDEVGDANLDPAPSSDFYGDPMLRLTEIIADVGAATSVPTRENSDYWGGPGGATAAGLLFACGALPVALLLVGLGRLLAGRRFLMQGGWW